MTDEEMERIVDRVSRNVYNMLHSFSWFVVEAVEAMDGETTSMPSYEEAIRD